MKKILLALIAVSPLIADECCPPLFDACSCDPGPCNAQVSLRTTQPGGIGYPTGYTSLDLFYAPGSNVNFHPFLDFRAHVFNDGKPAFNTGLGLRYLPDCTDVVFGVNAYWDFRDAKHTSFSQVGLGFEALWANWDLRLNGYVPVNRHKKGYRSGFLKFQDNEAIFYRKYELALAGADLDLGYLFYKNACLDMRATLGGYYFQGDYGKHAGGGLFKLSSNMSDYFTASAQVSYDNLFKWIGQGEIAVNFSFGKTLKRSQRKVSCCDDLISLEKRLVEKPQRFEIIPTTSHKKRGRALSSVTGLPLKFIFVDNTSHSAGTFESPYPTLAQAVAASAAGDVIYIFPGNGTSTGLNTSTTLKNFQSLVGSGAPFEVLTRFGKINIPQLSAQLPQIAVTGSSAVQVNNYNTISGLSIQATATGSGIAGIAGGFITNLTVENCTIAVSGNGGGGTPLCISAVVQNDILIQKNNLFNSGTGGPSGAVILNLGSAGSSQSNVTISRNFLSSTTATQGIVCQTQGQAFMNLLIEQNVSILTTSTSQVINFTISAQDSTSMYGTIRNNTISTSSNIDAGISCSAINSANAFFDIANNIISTPVFPSSGVLLLSNTTGQLTARLVNNQSNAPTGGTAGGEPADAYSIVQLGPSVLTLESPNGALSGVQNINTGHFTQTGTVNFIPMN